MLINNCTLLKAKTHSSKSKIIYIIYIFVLKKKKEGWVPKNWCFWTVVLEKTFESPLDYREIKPVNPTGNQPWIFTGRTGAEAPIPWPPDTKNRLILEKTLMLGKTEGKRRGQPRTRWLDGITNSMEWVWASSRRWWRQGNLACCSLWGLRESDMIEQLNNIIHIFLK